MYRNPAKHLTILFVQIRNFYYLLDFLGFRHDERRDTMFTMLTVHPASALNSLTQPTRMHPAANNWTLLGPNLN